MKNKILIVFCMGLTACEAQKVQDQVKDYAQRAYTSVSTTLQAFFSGGEKKEVASALENRPQDPSLLANKANSEILAEMMTVVFKQNRENIDIAEFKGLVNSLNEGASLEGIYRGLIAGAKYRGLESYGTAALPNVVKVFAIELAHVQDGMQNPRDFSAAAAKAIPEIDYPEETDAGSVKEGTAKTLVYPGKKPEVAADSKQVFEERALKYAQIFVGASSFTLKRILCEEALARMDELGVAHDQVAQWYRKMVERTNEFKIDFGLAERNQPDLDFHFRWAIQVPDDRIKWETLNRYHRILNSL